MRDEKIECQKMKGNRDVLVLHVVAVIYIFLSVTTGNNNKNTSFLVIWWKMRMPKTNPTVDPQESRLCKICWYSYLGKYKTGWRGDSHVIWSLMESWRIWSKIQNVKSLGKMAALIRVYSFIVIFEYLPCKHKVTAGINSLWLFFSIIFIHYHRQMLFDKHWQRHFKNRSILIGKMAIMQLVACWACDEGNSLHYFGGWLSLRVQVKFVTEYTIYRMKFER